MPYKNVPKSKWKDMDSCVKKVMSEQKVKKERAIAICYSSIMGKAEGGEITKMRPININFYGDYWANVREDINENKQDTIKNKAIRKEVDKKMATKKDIKVKKQEEVKEEEEKKEEVQAPVEEVKEETPAEEVKEEVKEETPAEKVKEEVKEEVPAEEVKEEKPADIEQSAKVTDLLKSVIKKIEDVEKKLKKGEEAEEEKEKEKEEVKEPEPSAPAEGVASDEEAPESGEGKAPVEEKEGASTEGAEVNKAMDKVAGSLEKLESQMEKFEESFKSLDGRLTTLEKQPVPSKVSSPVVVSKGGSRVQSSHSEDERLAEIKRELSDLEDMKKNQLGKYQMGKMWEKAISLVDEKNSLLSKNQA